MRPAVSWGLMLVVALATFAVLSATGVAAPWLKDAGMIAFGALATLFGFGLIFRQRDPQTGKLTEAEFRGWCKILGPILFLCGVVLLILRAAMGTL